MLRVVTKLTGTAHPITKGMDEQWPPLLGFQRLVAKPGAEVLATVEGWPLLVTGRHGQGHVLGFASDIASHWAPRSSSAGPGTGNCGAGP
jgi:uncharacterized membrane protein